MGWVNRQTTSEVLRRRGPRDVSAHLRYWLPRAIPSEHEPSHTKGGTCVGVRRRRGLAPFLSSFCLHATHSLLIATFLIPFLEPPSSPLPTHPPTHPPIPPTHSTHVHNQRMEHKGIRFWCYNAGHVLGAAMFMIEIGGLRVLYTGDYSMEDDRWV